MKRELNKIYTSKIYNICLLAYIAILVSQIFTLDVVYDELILDFDLIVNMKGINLVTLIVASIPFVYLFYDEYRDGFYNVTITRNNREKYIVTKVFQAWISGFSISLIGNIFLIIALVLKINPSNVMMSTEYSVGSYYSTINPTLALISMIFGQALYASIWPVISIWLFSCLKNKYVIMASPLIIFFITNLIFSGKLELLNLKGIDLMNSSATLYTPLGGIPYAICYTGIIFMLGIVILREEMDRRRING